jgi:hypothetical protein
MNKLFFSAVAAVFALGLLLLGGGAIAQQSIGQGTFLSFRVDNGTKTATATAGAATLNKGSGKVTTEALATAAAANYTLTLTNSTIAAADQVYVSVAYGTSTAGTPVLSRVQTGAGTATIVIRNSDAAAAFNGTLVISYVVIKA